MSEKSRRYKNYNKPMKQHLLRESSICALCGDKFQSMKDVSIDHILPLSKGGDNSRTNLQLAHFWCNEKKGNNV